MEIKKVLNYVNKTKWENNVPCEVIAEIAENFVKRFEGENIATAKTFHRICGESGSGKTTQAAHGLLNALQQQDTKACHIAVRTFANLHPNYNLLLQKHGSKMIREQTNGFALRCLCYALEKLFKKGYLVILEVTLLHPIFEEYVLSLVLKYNYKAHFHIMAVAPKIRQRFIKQRACATSGGEAGRVTLKSSSNYFNKIFFKSLRRLFKLGLNSPCVIWNAFDKKPCFVGSFKNAKKAYKKNKRLIKKAEHAEQALQKEKARFYIEYLTLQK